MGEVVSLVTWIAAKRGVRAKTKRRKTMLPAKQANAMAEASDAACRAFRQSDGNPDGAMELLWVWSRQNSSLRTALIRVAISNLIRRI